MICVLQKVSSSSVSVGGEKVGSIGKGLLLLLCAVGGDTEEDARLLAKKIPSLRIFEDENGVNNRSLLEEKGEILVVSNFTIAGEYRKGNRPSYIGAMEPVGAEKLYRFFISQLREAGTRTECGVFGADMSLSIQAEGPMTLVIDSNVLRQPRRKSEKQETNANTQI